MAGLLATLAEHPDVVPPEEIRFGVVLNGGVSLAVWMGGAVLELDRLVKARSDLAEHRLVRRSPTYEKVLRLAGCTARVDVIAGTSAGGINGAALALGQVNAAAEIASLRDIWVEQGRIETMLRQPFRGAPTSLLQGDEFFLPRLRDGLARLAEPRTIVDRADAPIDLTITTTVLGGNQIVTVDALGERLPQQLHAGRFRWQRRPDRTDREDPFGDSAIDRTVDRLALAARSTASFPFAFEPSFVPVNSPGNREPAPGLPLSEEQRLHPDMRDVVHSWGGHAGDAEADRSRFVIDGGLLANTPTRDALRAVDAMPGTGPVRRVMLLVYPHAEPPHAEGGADRGDPPTVVGMVGGLMDALTAQGGRTFVDELEEHNKAAAGRRGTRGEIVEVYADPAALEGLTGQIFQQYRQLRRWRTARDLADQVTDGPAELPSAWNYERVRRAAESAQRAWETGPHPEAVPFVPAEAPTQARAETTDGWGWGMTTALGIVETATDLMRRLIWVLPRQRGYEPVQRARAQVSRAGTEIRRLRRVSRSRWVHAPLAQLRPDEKYWTLRLLVDRRTMLGADDDRLQQFIDTEFADRREELTTRLVDELEPGALGRLVREQIRLVATAVHDVAAQLAAAAQRRRPDEQLDRWHALLAAGSPPPEQVLTRLLQLEIAATTLGDEVRTGLTLPLEVVQLSARTRSAFARFTDPAKKLGGMSVNRFGGFLKRSWRVNDWTWGRIDAAGTLCRIVLNPARVRRAAEMVGYLGPGAIPVALAAETVDGVVDDLFAPERRRDAQIVALRDQAVEELTAVFDLGIPTSDLNASLPGLAELFAWALHLESVPVELPALGQAIRADLVDGANRRSRGALFLTENENLLARLEARDQITDPSTSRDAVGWDALAAFDRGGIGGEPLAEEGTSDQMIRTATTAAAVVATVVDSDRSGLRPIKPVTRPLRGVALLPYWVITGLSSRSVLARGLALLGLSLGGALLALALFGALPQFLSGPGVALGAGAVLGALAFGAMRSGTILHGLVLLSPIVPLVAYAADGAGPRDASARQGLAVLACVGGLLVGLMVLGSLPATTGSVFGALDRLADRQHVPRSWWFRRPLGVLVVVVRQLPLLAVAAPVAAAVAWLLVDDWQAPAIGWAQRHLGLLEAVAVAAFLLGCVVAWALGLQLQIIRPTVELTGAPGDASRTTWRFQPLAHPAGATAGWSVLYGAGYLVIAWVLLRWQDLLPDFWLRAALATAVVLGVVLLLLVPLWLPLRAIWRIWRAELLRVRIAPPPQTVPIPAPIPVSAEDRDPREVLVRDLTARGVSYRVFLGAPDVRKQENYPPLRRLGPLLLRRTTAARAQLEGKVPDGS